MKHIFFAYPAGRVGVALLLLRLSLVLWLASVLIGLLATGWILVAVVICLLMTGIGIGIATRVAAGSCAVAVVLTVWPMQGATPLDLTYALVAAALALIGPGAVSADALLFGRRTMRLPE